MSPRPTTRPLLPLTAGPLPAAAAPLTEAEAAAVLGGFGYRPGGPLLSPQPLPPDRNPDAIRARLLRATC